MTSKLKYNPLLKLNLQEENEGEEITVDQTLDPDSHNPIANSAVASEFNTIIQRIDNYQDVDVSDLAGFESAVVLGATGSVRIHLRSDITLTSDVSYNLDNVQVYGHDNNINLQNHTFTVQGNTCYFYQVRFNANSNVNANSASNYSNACINLFGTSSSTRFFFEYVIFRNFLCKASDISTNIFNVKNVSGAYPSLHLYLMFCEVMTNYMQDNINSCTAIIYHSGSLNALTCHNVDFWGNANEANSCGNWCYMGNSLAGLAKLGWISDGSSVYNKIADSLTPNMVNQYNPSFAEFQELANTVANLIVMHPISQILADSENSNFNPDLCIYISESVTVDLNDDITINYACKFIKDGIKQFRFNGEGGIIFNKNISAFDCIFRGNHYYTFNNKAEFYKCTFYMIYDDDNEELFSYFINNCELILSACAFRAASSIDISNYDVVFSGSNSVFKIFNVNVLLSASTKKTNHIRIPNNNTILFADNSAVFTSKASCNYIYDDSLSLNSNNIVPNSVITAAINDLQNQINNFSINFDIIQSNQGETSTDYSIILQYFKINNALLFIEVEVGVRLGGSGTVPAGTILATLDFNLNYEVVFDAIDKTDNSIVKLVIYRDSNDNTCKIMNIDVMTSGYTGSTLVLLKQN